MKYFEEYLSPKIANGIVDFIEMGLIPDVEGIYREDLLETAGRLPWIEMAQKSWRPGGKRHISCYSSLRRQEQAA